jgi:hypothetical protein
MVLGPPVIPADDLFTVSGFRWGQRPFCAVHGLLAVLSDADGISKPSGVNGLIRGYLFFVTGKGYHRRRDNAILV